MENSQLAGNRADAGPDSERHVFGNRRDGREEARLSYIDPERMSSFEPREGDSRQVVSL